MPGVGLIGYTNRWEVRRRRVWTPPGRDPFRDRIGADRVARSILALPREGLPPAGSPARDPEGEIRLMRPYEMMVIIDGDVDDPKAQAWMKTVSEGVAAAGGTLHGKIDWWGKRQFAYPINKKPSGYYMVAQILAIPGSLDELERVLRLADDVVRHKLIRLPEVEAERRGMAVTAA
jgi:small subunit ribosomal protein S6